MTNICKTKYPIVLVHGLNCRDFKPLNYWGRIPKSLIKNGAEVFFGGQDAGGTIESNAKMLKDQIINTIIEERCKKVNIIAHSKGGLEVRYMIHELQMDSYVASLTTISTPHYGSRTIDKICDIPKIVYSILSGLFNFYYRCIGDKNPNFYNSIRELRTYYCSKFNEEIINSPSVYYQSYGSLMKNSCSDFFLKIPYFIVRKFEGENDGLVAIKSVEWGDFKGILRCNNTRGISHLDIVDFRRRNIGNFDIVEFYISLVSELKDKGF